VFSQNSTPLKIYFKFQVSQAQKPTSVVISGPFEEGVANLSISDKINVNCIVDNAHPRPLIAWYVNDMELKDLNVTEKDENESYIQTITYIPGMYLKVESDLT
jgi:hypothetical protein